ncbi:hypothetical protein ElyMa_002264700 [Elysia marginata]|uniref:Uncharacterized protein n=1 Tax=Elysia marginata TaxID=1093978 RepID=A0AAV4FYN1_9GAST|nr:hypothetical protein ElyMa_002264700 [Elysia marginata]
MSQFDDYNKYFQPLPTSSTESGFPNPPVCYQAPPQLVKMDYGMIGSAPGSDGIHQVPQTQLKQQPPHFGGVPTFQQAQFVATSYAPGFYPAGQGPGVVAYPHSSHASSSASEAASENIQSQGVVQGFGRPRFPYQQQPQQNALPGQGYPYQMVPQQQFHPMMPAPRLSHHQLVQHQQQQQQLYIAGRNSPAVMMHPDGQVVAGNNYTGNLNMNQNQSQQGFNSQNPPQHHPQTPSAPPQRTSDDVDSSQGAVENPPSYVSISTPITVETTGTTGATTTSHPSSSDSMSPSLNTSPSAKPLIPTESGRPPSVASNTDGEEE